MTDDKIPDLDESEAEADEDDEESHLPPLQQALRSLPLVEDDVYLGMQATNLAIVAAMLEPIEEDLAGEYWVHDRLPLDKFMSVSALTQLWVFGVYEFLRTWRQWVEHVLRICDDMEHVALGDRPNAIGVHVKALQQPTSESPGGVPYAEGLERASSDAAYLSRLREALYRSDLPFRQIEALRVHLAKHETPKASQYASGAGYGRLGNDRSIQFQVPLGKNEVTMVSRRGIGKALREMATDLPLFVLTPGMQAVVRKFPASSYGIRRVVMTLDDGTTFEGAVAWQRHVVWVKGHDGPPPFEISRIVAIQEKAEEE
jgi:hypothetical protein